MLSLRRGTQVPIVGVLTMVLAACSTPTSTLQGDTVPEGGGTVAVEGGVAELGALDLAFSATTITAPAGEAFTISFTNNDSDPHNVAIYAEEGGADIAIGDVIDGGQTNEVAVDALEAGTYYFQCDLHPEMNGTLVIEG